MRAHRARPGPVATVRGEGAAKMQPTHQRQHQQESLARSEPVPVRGDKEQDAGAQQQAAEAEREPRRPSQGGTSEPLVLPGTDAGGGVPIEQPGFDPALERRLPGRGHRGRYSALLVWR
jgi:hypothetical protein